MNTHTTLSQVKEAKARLESNIESLLVGFKMGTGLTVLECDIRLLPDYPMLTSSPTFRMAGLSVTVEPL